MKQEPITKKTRRKGRKTVLPKLNARSRLILHTLGDAEMTASEITDRLVARHEIPYYNRNFVAPRLTELKEKGLVETCGRRPSTRSKVTEAIWRKTKPEQEGGDPVEEYVKD